MSTVTAAKAALVTTMETALAAENCPVFWGLPDWEPDDLVVVQGAGGTLSYAGMGPGRPRDERYTLISTISCYRGGSSQQVVTERAVALFNLIEAAIRANPDLSGTVQSALVASWEMEEGLSLGEGDAVMGRVCEIIIRVDVRARV